MKKTVLFALSMLSFGALQAQITLESTHENLNSATIGVFQGITFREGGFSAMQYIPNTNGTEFWIVTDRGVNIDAANANTSATTSAQYPTGCVPTYDKIYAFPSYAPKIMRIKIVGNEVQILQTITLKRPNGTEVSGLINPTGFGSTAAEVASTSVVTDCADFDANTAAKDVWGIDSEGLDIDSEGNFWICEEGGPTIWKVNPNGVVLKRYTPYSLQYPEDVAIDPAFAFRRNNRGFEGLTITPNGKIYAIIQSPMYYKNMSGTAGSGTLGNSRIHRILEIDPATNTTQMFAYVNEGPIGTSSDIRPRDLKIGDLKAINNTTFLVIEQGARGVQNIKKLYHIDIVGATPVVSGLAYASNSKTLEELDTPANLTSNWIIPVLKTLVFDLHANGWPTTLDKAEGITIIDANTIAICNDNDYGQFSALENGIAAENNIKSTLFIYKLNGANALQNYIPNNNVVLVTNDLTGNNLKIQVHPNPFQNVIHLENIEERPDFSVVDVLGTVVLRGKLQSNTLNLESLKSGVYFLQVNGKAIKIVKN
ncbi:esterase-like activity of phytase family protein [Flavobacterium sp. SM15]|uniref:esterase-like activity of phytase family protein n=1 Tax=Flavobacterium sp. SM15 TaxID=2908005 RepID=UPI001EDB9BD6|nr:esterase-like activity of phytase family protein [Flavobacterium sp. SM15]MCG2610391.1 esterase-like activity of phytase family protein [Flavobacterium sp. SM15]